MSILAEFDKKFNTSHRVTKLTYEGKIIGFRVRVAVILDNGVCVPKYYDFSMSRVTDQGAIAFLRGRVKDFDTQELVEHNGLLMTQAEKEGRVSPLEVKEPSTISDILNTAMKSY